MKLLKELQNSKILELSHTQQGTLALVVASDNPKSAYDITSGSENLETSRKMLDAFEFIKIVGNSIVLTYKGIKASQSYNITDERGDITDVGKALIADILDDKHSWNSTL